MDAATRALVRRRAGDRCEYCLLRQEHDLARLQIEHVIARQHGGVDAAGNLALVCIHRNLHKGTNLSGIDPESGAIVSLFHPRHQRWGEHFLLLGATIVGATDKGRATVQVLRMNEDAQVSLRSALIARGVFPLRLHPLTDGGYRAG